MCDSDHVGDEVRGKVISILPWGKHHGLQRKRIGHVLQDLRNVELQGAWLCCETVLTIILQEREPVNEGDELVDGEGGKRLTMYLHVQLQDALILHMLLQKPPPYMLN